MYTRRTFLLSVAGALTPAVAVAAADEPEIGRILVEVTRARASLRTLAGPFTQERTIGLLASKVVSKGVFTLLRPDHLRWELAPPDSVTYWIGPEGVAYRGARSEGKVPATGEKIARSLEDLKIVLSGDLALLRDRYDLRLVSRDPNVGVHFEAKAKAATMTAGRMRGIDFTLHPDLVRPAKVVLAFGEKDRTEIVFGPLERDKPVDIRYVRAPF